MKPVFYIFMNNRNRLEFRAKSVTDDEIRQGFWVGNIWIPPHEILHTERAAFKMLDKLNREVSAPEAERGGDEGLPLTNP